MENYFLRGTPAQGGSLKNSRQNQSKDKIILKKQNEANAGN